MDKVYDYRSRGHCKFCGKQTVRRYIDESSLPNGSAYYYKCPRCTNPRIISIPPLILGDSSKKKIDLPR